MTAKEKVAPLEAKPFYGNSECADCNDKLYGKKAFWVPTTGKTPGKKLVCEKCAEVAESLPAEPEHCPNCNHKAHYALRCGALIATGSDGEFAEEVRCECLNWVAEPKPAPSTATGITEDQKRMVNRALDQLDAMLTLPESGDLEEKCQELLQDWEAGTSGFTNDEIEMAEIGFRGGFKAALKLKPQLGDQIVDANKMVDSSSISTEPTFIQWWVEYDEAYQELPSRYESAHAAWAAAKGEVRDSSSIPDAEPNDMQKQMAHDDGLIATLQEDKKRLRQERAEWQRKYFDISRALSGVIDKNGDLIKRIQWLEHEKDEIRNSKPQPDSSSISTDFEELKESANEKWWLSGGYVSDTGVGGAFDSGFEAGWNAAKGQSNGR